MIYDTTVTPPLSPTPLSRNLLIALLGCGSSLAFFDTPCLSYYIIGMTWTCQRVLAKPK